MTTETNNQQQGKRNYDRTSYILVVDDDNTLLKFFKIHLNKFFSRVIVVKNAKEAIDTLREKEIDLVLSDIRMPAMDGLELVRKMRHEMHDLETPVVLISTLGTEEDLARGKEAGATGYIRKPITPHNIMTELQQLLGLRKR